MFRHHKLPFLRQPIPPDIKIWDMGLGAAERDAGRQDDKKMDIFVKTLTGDTLHLQINNDETAARVICEAVKAGIDVTEVEVDNHPCKEVKLVIVGCGGVGKSALVVQTCFGKADASIKKDTLAQHEELWDALEKDFQSKIILLEKDEKLLKHKPKKVYPPRRQKPQPQHVRQQKPRKAQRKSHLR